MTEIALAVVHDRVCDRVLLVKRKGTSDLAGWAFPGGKIEAADHSDVPTETICRAARRELAEETGVIVNGGGTPLLTRIHPTTGAKVSYVYFSERDIDDRGKRARRMEPSKADQCRWMPRDQLDHLFGSGFSGPVLHKMNVEAERVKTTGFSR